MAASADATATPATTNGTSLVPAPSAFRLWPKGKTKAIDKGIKFLK